MSYSTMWDTEVKTYTKMDYCNLKCDWKGTLIEISKIKVY